MTSLSINTTATNVNTVLSMPTASSFSKKKNLTKSLFSYAVSPKAGYRKPSVQFISSDWDLNRNELEFE